MTHWMRRVVLAAAVVLVACGGDSEDEDAVACGDASCAAGEFCLTEQIEGEEILSCVALPDGCDDADHMCFDEPDVCVEDWAAEVCPDAFITGCFAFGSAVTVSCSDGSTTE